MTVETTTPNNQGCEQYTPCLLVHDLCERLDASQRHVARLLRMAESTVRFLCEKAREFLAGVVRPGRGRPKRIADRLLRNDILTVIHATAGRISVRELREAYPDVTRVQLRSLRNRYRRVLGKRRRRGRAVLTWTRVKTVWAMDFTEIAGGVDDLGRNVLVVRDLASGYTLGAVPGLAQDANSVRAVLARLFVELGAPLVLKSDNGSGFIAEDTKALLREHRVLPLYSPPGTPSYNGACEAGVGSVKHRAEELAASRAVDAGMSIDDLAAAREQANQQPARRRAGSPTRQHLWQEREDVSADLRNALHERRATWLDQLCTERGIASFDELPHAEQASLDRFAIGKALSELELLTTWRR